MIVVSSKDVFDVFKSYGVVLACGMDVKGWVMLKETIGGKENNITI